MPTPIRPGSTPQPSPVTGPSTPVSSPGTGPATPAAPATGPADRFLGPGPGSGGSAGPGLAAKVPLSTVDGVELSIGKDGKLTIPGDAGTLDDTLKVNRLALKGLEAANPFAAVTDKRALDLAAGKLALQHQAGLMPPSGDKNTLDLRTSRSGSLALLEQTARRAGELGDPALQKKIVDLLVTAIAGEPFRALKDFAWEGLVAGAAEGKLPEVGQAREAIYPSAPPREKWLKDGVLTVAYYIDNEGSELNYQLSFLRSLGLKEKKVDDQNYVFTREARGGQPKIEVLFKSPKTHADKPALLEKIDDPSVDIIAYTGHAGYGHRVDHAIGHGARGSGEDKLVVLMQCWGEGNVESLERAFPDAQVVSTTEPSTDNHDQLMFRNLLNGVLAGKDWKQIQGQTVEGMKNMMFLGEASPEKHFFFPTSREVLAGKYDRDTDGVRDAGDRVFNVVYPKRLDAAGGFDPVAQAIADDALDGSALTKATSTLSLVMRYNALLSPADAAKVKWAPETPEPAGFFTPADGDLHAFKFTFDDASGKLKIALSTRFAHADENDLGRMLAIEAGQFLGQKAGLDDAGRTALALTMAERAAHQGEGWNYASKLTDEPWAEETMLLKRYGLSGVSLADVSAAMGHADDLKPEHLAAVKRLVAGIPELTGASTRAPQRVGEPIAVPAGTRLGANSLDNESVERVLKELGVPGKLEAFGPTWLSSGEANNVIAVVRDAAGKTQQVGLSLDADGYVQLAARIPLDVDKVKARAGRDYLGQFAKATGTDEQKLLTGYEAALRGGRDAAGAVAQVIAAERKNVPLGKEVPRLELFDKLRSYGLATPTEHAQIQDVLARVYPTGDALSAEQAVLAWLDASAPTQKDVLRAGYLDALASDGTRLGAGLAIVKTLEALPPDAAAKFPLKDVLNSGLVAEGGKAEVLKTLARRSGEAPAVFVLRYADTQLTGWMATPDREALSREVGALAAANTPAREVLIAFAEKAKAADAGVPSLDTGLLEAAGLLPAADAQAVARRLEELRR